MDKTYQELEIHLRKKSKDNYLAQTVDSKGKIRGEKPFVLEMDKLKMREDLQQLEKLALSSELVKDDLHVNFGKHMFNLVFGDGIKAHYDRCLKKDQPLRIRIRIDESARELHNVPWEFLHDGEDFLVTQSDTLISRLPLNIKRKKKDKLEQALSMLVVISNPVNLPDHMVLNTEREQEVILGALDKLHRERKLDIDFVDDASLDTIQDYLSDKEYHILHFTGHGVFREDQDKGFLLLEDSNHLMSDVENEEVATILQNHKSLRLVVLSACQSAKASNNSGYPDLSRTLLGKGVPAVLSMQHSVLDKSATDFAGRFYRSLAGGKPVDAALFDARMALYAGDNRNRVDFATPVLFLNDADAINVARIKVEEKTTEVKAKPFHAGELEVMRQGFVGRRRELRAIREGFVSGRKRAYMIHGFGGIGKSVLATRTALQMEDHFEGLKAIRVKEDTSPEQILNDLNGFLMIAGIHDLNKCLNQPIPINTKTEVLVQILNGTRLLIIFDNFEDALTKETKRSISSPELSTFIQLLLKGVSQNTKFIFTTRHEFDPLDGRLPGQIGKINLPEFSFPFMLFLMNNFEALQNLPVVKKLEIYQRMGGHPFALGVLDKHAQITSVDSVLSNLAPVKKEMVEFTLLDMTYNQLSASAQKLLKRMSVFDEVVPLEALQWMMGDDDDPTPEIGEELKALSGWGLLVKKEEYSGKKKVGLYAMHQLVRDFVADRLKGDKTQQTKALLVRAARFYEMEGTKTESLWDWLHAREYYYKAHEYVKAVGIVNGLAELLVRWGHIELLMRLLNESIATLEGQRSAKTRALHNLGVVYQGLGDYKQAERKYEESLKIKETLGDKSGIASTFHQLGNLYYLQGNYKEAVKKYEESLNTFRELGEKAHAAAVLHQLGIIHQDQGNYKEAVKKYEESFKIKEELGDKSGIAITLHQLGMIHQYQGNYKEAVKKYEESLEIAEELGDRSGIAMSYGQLGRINEEQKDYREALRKYLIALSILKELGSPEAEKAARHLSGLRGKMGEKEFKKAWKELTGEDGKQ